MNPNTNLLSVVVPVYMGRVFLRELYERIKKSAESAFPDFELILVNDASPDNAWPDIVTLCQEDTRVKGINLSRNFGQHYAITAGLTHATGDWIVVMDCDLQDVPEEIPNLYKKALDGFSVVLAQRINRDDSWFKRTQSVAFHAVFSYLTDQKSDSTVSNFGIYQRKVIKAVLEFGDCVKCFPLIVAFVGFKTACIPVAHDARKFGKTSYTLSKSLHLATNLMLAYSNKPLRLFIAGGFFVVALSLLISIYYLVLYIRGNIGVSGFTSLILSVWLVGGMLMMQLGIVGVYLGRVFNQTKNRPTFIVDETINTTRDNQ